MKAVIEITDPDLVERAVQTLACEGFHCEKQVEQREEFDWWGETTKVPARGYARPTEIYEPYHHHQSCLLPVPAFGFLW